MRILGLLLIVVGLFSCHSPQSNYPDNECLGCNQFQITHKVKLKKRDRILEESYQKRLKKPIRSSKRRYRIEQDAAPKGKVPTFFSKVIPKHEPVSRYGNPDTYSVMGKQYDVMTNSTGYKARGIASWYGTKFHKYRTSSGEKYDMYALTAAHKTLPLPTYVRVKNLENGKVAIIKVNDRGPFHESRILDLSYGAAVKLGIFPKGTAKVEIEALKTTRKDLHYFVQAGAFESQALANELREKISHLTTSPVFIQKNQHQYLVQLGPFATKEMVVLLKQHLEANNVHGSFSMLM